MIGFISTFFSGRGKTFADVRVEDLNKERIHLDNEERRLEKEMARLRQQDAALLSEYAAARQAGDKTQQKILGRKLQELRHRIATQDQRHSVLARHKRMVNNLLVLKDNEAFFQRLGRNSILRNMDITELQAYVEQVAADGELNNEKMESLLATLEDTSQALAGEETDNSLDDFLAQLDEEIAEQASRDTEAISDEELDAALASLERIPAPATAKQGADDGEA